MRCEREEQKTVMEVEFKNQVFATNPELFKAIFLEEEKPEEIDWVRPSTEADVDYMMEQLRTAGAFPE